MVEKKETGFDFENHEKHMQKPHGKIQNYLMLN